MKNLKIVKGITKMELRCFSIYDVKVEAYQRPFFVRSVGEGIRMWMDIVSDKQSIFAKHPQDFCLMEIGGYDEATGRFTNMDAPKSHGLAIEYVEKATNVV